MIKPMYAIVLELDTEKLKKNYPGELWQNAYDEVCKFLADRGFSHQQGNIYYGDELQTEVKTCVVAIDMSKKFKYLKNSIAYIRILQLLENDDLMPRIEDGNPN